jgi:hypothetical protein
MLLSSRPRIEQVADTRCMSDASTVELLRRDDLAAAGIRPVSLHRMQQAGDLAIVHPGVYVRREAMAALITEDRMVVHARAVALVSRRPPIFSHLTAAARERARLSRR